MSSTLTSCDHPLQSRFIGMFSYGSNNEQQLRGRVNSPQLSGRPAYLDGYVRVFGYSSGPWAGGSVASVAPKEGGRVYGRFYLMTPQEVEILDMYEHVKQGGYSKEAVMVNVHVAEGAEDGVDGNAATVNTARVESSAITYVMSPHLVHKFVQPTPQYLTAVYRTLTSSFPEFSGRPIEICDHTGTKRSEWTHPGIRALPLEAFLLEVGLREEPSWTFPTVLGPLAARLAAAGIPTTDALCEAATSGDLLSKVAAATAAETPAAATAGTTTAAAAYEGESSPATPAAEQEGDSTETAKWAEAHRSLRSRATVPDFTQQTVDIIARIVSGQCS
eukprot:g10935.t1